MFPRCISVMLLCLQCGWGYNAGHIVQMMNLQVEYGESATLPCNGSVLREEEGSVRWEVMGEDVAVLQGGEFQQGDKYKDRVQLASEEKLREGDWSVVLQHAVFSDSDMYECIWQERKTISIVWLTVMAVAVERSLEVAAGDAVLLTCSVQISRSQSPDDLQVWWARNGSTILSTKRKALFSAPVVSNPEDTSRLGLLIDKEVFHLHMNPTMMSDNGEYHCWYKTKDSDDPKPGIPESITLTVLETNPADLVFHPDETTTGTEDWVSTSPWFTIPWTEEVTDVETTESPLDLTTVLLEVSTLPMKATTESQPMEGLEVSVTSFPEEDETTTGTEDWVSTSPWFTIPWTEEVTDDETTESPLDLTTVLLEVFTLPMKATAESQPMEGLEVSVTSLPEEGTPETSESLRRDTLPWIRIGLIAGVLLVTAVILCILGALRKM